MNEAIKHSILHIYLLCLRITIVKKSLVDYLNLEILVTFVLP